MQQASSCPEKASFNDPRGASSKTGSAHQNRTEPSQENGRTAGNTMRPLPANTFFVGMLSLPSLRLLTALTCARTLAGMQVAYLWGHLPLLSTWLSRLSSAHLSWSGSVFHLPWPLLGVRVAANQ